MEHVNYFLDLYFPPEWLKAALILSLLSTWVLVGLYAYLNRYTRRQYFALWTAGWLFYALWITSTITFLDANDPPEWEWIKLLCIGICAIFLFWGSLQFSGNNRGQREMGLTVCLMIAWSYVARDYVGGTIWLSLPLFSILMLSSFLTAACFFQRRFNSRYVGASMLGFGFVLWGCQMAAQPFVDTTSAARPTFFVLASITQLIIAVGMIVLMLEEVRGETHSLREQVKTDARLTRRLQKEIATAEGKYEHLFEHASDSIFIIDPSSMQILDVNRAALALTGYSRDELIQLRFVNLCSFLRDKEKEIAESPEQVHKMFTTYGNMPLQRKDNNTVLTEGSASVMNYSKGQTVQIFLREVTERRRLEQQLRQAEKLSALGQLISGVAHELNNPLAVISGYAQLLAMRPAVEEKTRNDLLKIQRESERASKIVQNFLAFARKHPMEKTNVNINSLVEVSLELMDYDLRASGIRLIREVEPNLPDVFADPNQLEQVFLNIITNAVHAMEGSPREKVIKIATSSSGKNVTVIVTDHGKGIPTAILEKIFDPFFTTKEVGVGTGLGLSISFSIIKEHSGNIYAQNHAEGGAVFSVELPVSHMKKAAKKDEDEPRKKEPPAPPHRTFQVLVVDDEAAIQDVFAELLMDYSCRVTGASNGLHGLKHIEERDFDLVICDLKMPGIDGRRLFEKVKEIKPELAKKFVFITGDTNSPKTMDFLQKNGNRWIAKPFNFREVDSLLVDHFGKIQAEETRENPPPSRLPGGDHKTTGRVH